MGKIIATYHVKVTVRDDDEARAEADEPEEAPSIADVEREAALAVSRLGVFIIATATAERTDI